VYRGYGRSRAVSTRDEIVTLRETPPPPVEKGYRIMVPVANPDTALQQWMVETIVHVFLQMLRQARPLRFKNSSEAASRFRNQLRQVEI